VFALEFFADVHQFWVLVLDVLPGQLVMNLAAGYLLWRFGRRWGRFFIRFMHILPWRLRRPHAT